MPFLFYVPINSKRKARIFMYSVAHLRVNEAGTRFDENQMLDKQNSYLFIEFKTNLNTYKRFTE